MVHSVSFKLGTVPRARQVALEHCDGDGWGWVLGLARPGASVRAYLGPRELAPRHIAVPILVLLGWWVYPVVWWLVLMA